MRQAKTMSDLIYCVRFIRRDGAKPAKEDYYYWNRADAESHLQMFKDDDPDYAEMYDRIQLVVIHGQMSMVSQEIRFR